MLRLTAAVSRAQIWEKSDEATNVALKADNKTVIMSADTAFHTSTLMKLAPPAPGQAVHPLKHRPDAAGFRLGMVVQPARKNTRLMSGVRKANGRAMSSTRAQFEYKIVKGVWPMNNNKLPSSKHARKFAKLYAFAKDLPLERSFQTGVRLTPKVRL